jgi:carbon monoxide dehydrogenase subunit G
VELIGRSETHVAASPHAVWQTLADVAAWRVWMPGIRWAVLEGDLAVGAYVTIRPLRGRQTAYRVALVAPPHALALGLTFGPVASLLCTWNVESDARGTRVTYSVETGGPLGRWLVASTAERVHAEAPALLAALNATLR